MKYSLLLCVLCINTIFAQEITSLIDDRRKILEFGIDTEVISLIDELQNEKDTQLEKEIVTQFNRTANNRLRRKIIEYFEKVELNALEDGILEMLYDQPDEEQDILSILSYVRTFHLVDAGSALNTYLMDQRNPVIAATVKTIGELGLSEKIPELHVLFDDDSTADSVQSEILLALGKLKDIQSIDMLIDILEDIDGDKSNRWYACSALAEIGGTDSYAAIKKVISDPDTILRTYAIRAIARFDYPEVDQILVHDGLRDSFWRVRLVAIEEIEKKGLKSADDALQYRASQDPENKIRERAVQALAVLGGKENLDYLGRIIVDEKTAPSVRTNAAIFLIRNHASDTLPGIEKLISDEWEKSNSRIVEFVAKELSRTSNPRLAPVYERFLSHKNMAVQIYGIRGIGLNGITSLKSKLEEMNHDKAHPAIRKELTTALEQMN